MQVIWLIVNVHADFGTVANFRSNMPKAVQVVFRPLTRFCRDLELFTRDLVVIDRSKSRAINGRGRNFADRRLRKAIQDIDRNIETCIDELVANDEQEPDEARLSTNALKPKIQKV